MYFAQFGLKTHEVDCYLQNTWHISERFKDTCWKEVNIWLASTPANMHLYTSCFVDKTKYAMKQNCEDPWIWEDSFWEVIQVNPCQTVQMPNLMTVDDFEWKKNAFDKPNTPENITEKRRSDFGFPQNSSFHTVKSEEEVPAGDGIGA